MLNIILFSLLGLLLIFVRNEFIMKLDMFRHEYKEIRKLRRIILSLAWIITLCAIAAVASIISQFVLN